MNLAKYKLVKEDDDAFHLSDGKSTFPVAKKAAGKLSDEIRQHFAGGGEVNYAQAPQPMDDSVPEDQAAHDAAQHKLNMQAPPVKVPLAKPDSAPPRAPLKMADGGAVPPDPSQTGPSNYVEVQHPSGTVVRIGGRGWPMPRLRPEQEHAMSVAASALDPEHAGNAASEEALRQNMLNSGFPWQNSDTERAGNSLDLNAKPGIIQPTFAAPDFKPNNPAPPAAPPSVGSEGPNVDLKGFNKSLAESEAGQRGTMAEQKTEAERAGAEKSEALAQGATAAHDAAVLAQQQLDEHNFQVNNKMSEWEDAVKKASDMKLNPSRLFQNMSTGHKILAVLGSFLAGPKAADIIKDSIQNDIEAQKHDIESQKEKAGFFRNQLEMMQKQFGDNRLAEQGILATQLDWARQNADAIAAKHSGTQEGLNAQLASQKLQQEVATARLGAQHQAASLVIENKKANAEVAKANAMLGAKGSAAAGTDQILKELEDELSTNVTSPTLESKRQEAILALQREAGEKASPEVLKRIEEMVPGRGAGFVDKALGKKWAHERIQNARQIAHTFALQGIK
jgi:hypothetical protein